MDIQLPPALPTGAAANGLTPTGLAEHVNGQRTAILELRTRLDQHALSEGEFRQNIGRRVDEATAMLRDAKQKAAEDALSQHAGLPESEVVGRYGGPANFRLMAQERTIKLPSGATGTIRAAGYLDDPRPINAEQVAAQRAFRALAMVHSVLGRRAGAMGPALDATYRNFVATLAQTPTASRSMQVRSILDGSAGSGGELLPIPTLANIREPMRLQRRLAGLLQVEQHTNESWKEITQTGNFLMRKRGARNDDPARYERVKFTTSDQTISTYGYTGQVLVDDNLMASPDAVVGVAERAMAFLDRMEADTMEVQLLHSDTAATHQDTISTWTLGSYFTAGELDGSDSPVRQWIGWRATAFDDSATNSAAGALDEADWFGALNKMGNRALGSLVAATGIAVYFTQILPNAKFINRDYVGDNATLLTGQVLSIGGVPLILSEFIPADEANTGLYTGSGTYGSIVIGDTGGWRWDVVSALESDWEVSEQHRGAVYIGRKRNYRLTKATASGDKPAAVIYYL